MLKPPAFGAWPSRRPEARGALRASEARRSLEAPQARGCPRAASGDSLRGPQWAVRGDWAGQRPLAASLAFQMFCLATGTGGDELNDANAERPRSGRSAHRAWPYFAVANHAVAGRGGAKSAARTSFETRRRGGCQQRLQSRIVLGDVLPLQTLMMLRKAGPSTLSVWWMQRCKWRAGGAPLVYIPSAFPLQFIACEFRRQTRIYSRGSTAAAFSLAQLPAAGCSAHSLCRLALRANSCGGCGAPRERTRLTVSGRPCLGPTQRSNARRRAGPQGRPGRVAPQGPGSARRGRLAAARRLSSWPS